LGSIKGRNLESKKSPVGNRGGGKKKHLKKYEIGPRHRKYWKIKRWITLQGDSKKPGNTACIARALGKVRLNSKTSNSKDSKKGPVCRA